MFKFLKLFKRKLKIRKRFKSFTKKSIIGLRQIKKRFKKKPRKKIKKPILIEYDDEFIKNQIDIEINRIRLQLMNFSIF